MASHGTKFATALLAIAACFGLGAQVLLEGDLIFTVSGTANAITQATSTDAGIDHVAIVHYIGGEYGLPYVVEAWPPMVSLTPLDTLVSRARASGDSLVVARVATLDVLLSTTRALRYVGTPYDELYLQGDSALYCSELVQMCYVDIAGRAVFEVQPMSFAGADGAILPEWVEHYARFGCEVPQGLPGTNPAAMARDSRVTIVGSLNVDNMPSY